ncbi:MAG: flagellar biosynthesis protein FlhF [Planctomycetota bacterium]|jgi:flagellar biosynthesis protein FlhF
MKLRTFQARTMAEALDQVKRQLGRDAVILHTRTFSKGGLFGLGGRPMVEITAARGAADLPRYAGPVRMPPKSGIQEATAGGAASATAPSEASIRAPDVSALTAELGAVKSLVRDLVRETRRSVTPSLPEQLFESYVHLVEAQVSEEIAQRLAAQVRDELDAEELANPAAVRRKLAAYVESLLPTAGPIRLASLPGPSIIALVGPTGVGKTTTIAKLAANFRLRENRRVGLITLDTYRIAAVEQLRTYAQIINVPLEVVMSPGQLPGALERLQGCDVVLIDTAGRSQNDAIRMNELKCYLDRAKPHEVHLVLSSASSQGVVDAVLARFSMLGVDRVIFTKLDEAIGFGVILNCVQEAGARLSYVTTGQDVPDDIEVGDASRVAGLILGGELRRNPGPSA